MSGEAIKSFLLRAKDLKDTELKTLESSLSKGEAVKFKSDSERSSNSSYWCH